MELTKRRAQLAKASERRRKKLEWKPRGREIRKCFWTWRWGHFYKDGECVGCQVKEPYRGPGC